MSNISFTCLAHPILLDLNSTYLLKDASHKATPYVIFSTLLCLPLRLKGPPEHPILNHPQTTFTRNFTSTQQQEEELQLCIFLLYLWIANWKAKDSAPNEASHSLTALNFFMKYTRT